MAYCCSAMTPTRHSDSTNDVRGMHIFKGRYFNINRKLLIIAGLWPYERKIKKFVLRAAIMGPFAILTIPQFISILMHSKDIDRLMLNFLCIATLSLMNLKMLGMILAEENMKAMYRSIANHWQRIEDHKERNILHKYSERARTLTIFYSTWMVGSATIAASLPLFPKILDFTWPLENPRPNIYVTGGEYFFDRETQFLPNFLPDFFGIMLLPLVFVVVDTIYFVSVEHCCALYAIIRFRLLKIGLEIQKSPPEAEDIDSYEWLRRTIRLHQDVLIFTSLLNDSYSTPFFFTMIAAFVVTPLDSCAIIANLNRPIQLFPYLMCLGALMIHGLLLFYPGQRVIDHQLSLLDAAYCNGWYAVPIRTKKLLLVFMLRCSEPVLLTAGGLLPINLEIYSKIMKTSISYITVLSSFR